MSNFAHKNKNKTKNKTKQNIRTEQKRNKTKISKIAATQNINHHKQLAATAKLTFSIKA